MRTPSPFRWLLPRTNRSGRIPQPADSALPRLAWRIRVSALLVLLVTAAGAVGFYLLGHQHTSWSDAVFMSLITVSTVGYGEIVPLDTPLARVAAGLGAIIGFGALTFLFTSLSVFFLEKDLDQTIRRRRMEKEIRKLSGHYIICGFGRVGRSAALELQSTGRRFVAIDPNPAHVEEHKSQFPGLLFLHGDGSDDVLLEAADIADAAGIFAVTGDDSRNLMITVTAKQLNPQVRVVARAHELRNIPKMRKAGADDVVSPDFTGGMRIASAMLRPHVVGFLDEMLRSDAGLRVEEFVLPPDFPPTPVASLRLRGADYLLIAVRQGDAWVFNPAGETQLAAGQVLIAMAGPTGRRAIEEHILEFTR